MDIIQHYHSAHSRLLLLDYDGTLADFSPTPQTAQPTPEILALLTKLAAVSANTVVVVSGRDRTTMEAWLGHLPVGLSAEHGLFWRSAGGKWQTARLVDGRWKPPIRELMEDVLISGTEIEEKEMSIVWHYRQADPAAAARAATWLFSVLSEPAQALDLKLLDGHMAIEVTASGTDKGQPARTLIKRGEYDFILAAGDDVTDEDLFRALPPGSEIIKVGGPSPLATHVVSDPEVLRALLSHMSED